MATPENEYKIAMFKVKQQQPYEFKLAYAERRAWEFKREMERLGHEVHANVGGLDSLTMWEFLKNIGIYVPAVSVSSLEDKSVQEIHQELGIKTLTPNMSKVQVIRKFGFPVISKETAKKIEALQNPTTKNAASRHAYMTGYKKNGEFSKMMMLAECWKKKFAGLENENYGTDYQCAPFKCSDKCCYYMKEAPLDRYSKQHNSFPYMGLMASEGGRREKKLQLNGCNYISKRTIRSAPFAIFYPHELLRLAQELHVPVPATYGAICEKDGVLRTTKAQRTGCHCCGFGIHLESRPHRFDRLREDNLEEWEFWMYTVGWGEVLDYIGIGWEDDPPPEKEEPAGPEPGAEIEEGVA